MSVVLNASPVGLTGTATNPFGPNSFRCDAEQIGQTIELLVKPAWERGDVVELRALKTSKGTVSGYFDADHAAEFTNAAIRWSGDAQGIYFMLNPILRDCLGRAANRAELFAKHTTGDKEITHRHWLLIDTDPKRPSGISATENEHDLALARAIEIRAWLRETGWAEPIYADSGNGGHLLYRIDLAPDDGGLIQRTLKVLASQFADATVDVDLSVFNPARICKLYGTLACKGDSLPDRPHRLARFLEIPSAIQIVNRDALEALAPVTALFASQAPSTVSHDRSKASSGKLNVVEYLQSHGVEVGKSKNLGDGSTLWELKRCPWRPAESDGGPFVIQFADGKITAGCHHSQCDGKGWDDLRDLIDPDWRNAENKKGKGPSVSQQIVSLGTNDELFHTAENEAFVTIRNGNRRETYRVDGEDYRLILRRRLHEKELVVSGNSLNDAIKTLESKAVFDGPQQSVHVRTAQLGDSIYIDLCNDRWEAVEVTSDGWHIVNDPPVRFVRHAGMLPLPTPVEGGSVAQLREFINVTDADWPLAVAWLMAALRPTGPYPILLVNGEQGSCKSTTCRRLRSLVDPNTVALRDNPKNEQVLMIWAKNSHVIALDNLSSVNKDLSNAMCRLATGGGHSERSHYTNDSEVLFYAIRPQMLNGIGDIATRSDFLDRSLSICLPVVPKAKRKTEKELDERFTQVYPSIFGALLTAVSFGLRQLPEVEKQQLELPRLADFANWMIAVETALGWEKGTFIRAMNRNENEANELALADAPVAEAVRKFMTDRVMYEGGWTDLFTELNKVTDDATKRREGWPKDSRSLSNKLRERAPNLRGLGIAVEFHDTARPKRVALRSMQTLQSVGTLDELHHSAAVPACYGNDFDETDVARYALETMLRCWNAPPIAASVAPVAAPSLILPSCDGAQALLGQ